MFGLFKKCNIEKLSLSDELIKYMERKKFHFTAVSAQYELGISDNKCWRKLDFISGYNIKLDTEVVMKIHEDGCHEFSFERLPGPDNTRFNLNFAAPEKVVMAIDEYLRSKPVTEIVDAIVTFKEKDGNIIYSHIELSSRLDTAPQEYAYAGWGPGALRNRLSKTHSW